MEKIEYKGYLIKIEQDTDASSPREDDNLGTMVCFHRRYDLGDRNHGYKYPEELMRLIEDEKPVWLPLYLLDHSGLSMSYRDFNDQWDSGRVGIIYVSSNRIIAEYGADTPENRITALKVLKGEVETYDQYLRGDIYGYVIEKPAEKTNCETCGHRLPAESVDSCWGFYGYDECLNEAKGIIDRL